eukprot:3323972-Rhodomonas_salina.1
MSGTELAYGATRSRQSRSLKKVMSAIGLRARYAKSGTELACGAICLGACYAISGTELVYGATRGGPLRL